MSQPPFVLIHSPLVGALTWQPVADALRTQGYTVFVPELRDTPDSLLPFWRQHADSIALPIRDAILVGHSGAGALLPAISQKLNASRILFVDAVLQFEAVTRLELMASEGGDFAEQFETYLKSGGRFPNWTDQQLQSMIPDAALRSALLADIRPRGLAFFTERIDVPSGWDEIPCAYLQLSEFYSVYAAKAEAHGWPVIRHPSHHFAMVTEPEKVAALMVTLSECGRTQ